MSNLLGTLATLLDLGLVILGFGLIILIHELGHFIAARWAGIRVLAFAIGFGPAAFSYRKGMGWRRGSSESEYLRLVQEGKDGDISPTEYRLNWLPLGGYVKMLGQEDLNPEAVSDAPDSYQNTAPWKRMIVISAGVVANIVTAALLFMLVYTVGIETEPAKVGGVALDSPAAAAVPVNGKDLGISEPGLKAGDAILTINGERARSFNDLVLAVAMARRGQTVRLEVQREGVARPLVFEITPEVGALTGLLEIGVEPARTARIVDFKRRDQREQFAEALRRVGLDGVEPGMQLIAIDGVGPVESAEQVAEAIRSSDGRPVTLTFSDGTREVQKIIEPVPELELAFLDPPDAPSRRVEEHLAGLRPLMKVREAEERARAQGLRDGDIFVRIGSIEYPSPGEGMREIRTHAGKTLPISVLRKSPDGNLQRVDLEVRVSGGRTPRIGFISDSTALDAPLLASVPEALWPVDQPDEAVRPSSADLGILPGSSVRTINGMAVDSFADIRRALREATRTALDIHSPRVSVTIELALPGPVQDDGSMPADIERWDLSEREIRALHALSWRPEFGLGVFELEQIRLKAENPIQAISLGLHETKRVMLTTYLTFARLFEGTIRIEHLKGPVGIAHLGTRIAERGFIWLLFFLALVSVNLAVINFLPLPIVDGGQFLMIVYEQITGRPVPIPIQNALTLAGLALIATVFLIVTYNDIVGLFSG